MPNRTIYLPEDLDASSRNLGLNLSRLTQQAIKARLTEQLEATVTARIDAISAQAHDLRLDWTDYDLNEQRSEAGER